MIYTLLLLWTSAASAPGNAQVIEGFQSYEDCNSAYQEILKRKPQFDFKYISGVCMQVKDVR